MIAFVGGLVCSAEIRTRTARRIFDAFQKVMPNKIESVRPPYGTPRAHPKMTLYKRTGSVSYYHGNQHSNNNFSGLTLFVHGIHGNALLTGDCTLEQATDVLNSEINHVNNDFRHFFVVPHHGGEFDGNKGKLKIPKPLVASEAIISVGANNNYGHPASSTIKKLTTLFGTHIWKTCDKGDFEGSL